MKKERLHLQPWAPQDARSSRVRMRVIASRDDTLYRVWRELCDSLWEHDGELPADPRKTADDLGVPVEEFKRCMDILGPDDLGFLTIENGMIRNARITFDLDEKRHFRAEQALRGELGARKRWAAIKKQKDSEGHGVATKPDGDPIAPAKKTDGEGYEKHSLPLPIPHPHPPPHPQPLPHPSKKNLNLAPRSAPAAGAIGAYHRVWAARYGTEPHPAAKDVIAANTALKKFPEAERIRLVEAFVANDEPWLVDKAHRLGLLPGQLDRIRTNGNGKAAAVSAQELARRDRFLVGKGPSGTSTPEEKRRQQEFHDICAKLPAGFGPEVDDRGALTGRVLDRSGRPTDLALPKLESGGA